LWHWFPAEQSRVHWDAASILRRDPGESGDVTQPLSCLSNSQSLEDTRGRIVEGILALIAIYALYVYNDGTLFSQISDALSQWFSDQITEDVQR
jgi:hypothetical protein